MKFLGVVLISLAGLGTAKAVANGTVEEPHVSPWHARVYFYVSITFAWPCGGTLISPNYVLTAARCFTYLNQYKARGLYLYLGAWDVENSNENSSIISINLADVVIHEEYDSFTHANDIALIKLPDAVPLTAIIQPAKLATKRNVSIGDVARISGWQYPLREWDLSHQYLHAGNVAVVENSACQKAYPNYVIDDDTICASGTVAFCYGDEGVAFILNGEMVGMAYGAKDVLTPVEECPIIPQTYLSIDKYLNWIKANSDYQDN